MNVRSVDKLYRHPTTGVLSTVYDPALTPYGARVIWSDPAKGTQDFTVAQLSLPNNQRTVAGAQNYLNAIVNAAFPYDDPETGEKFTGAQTRVGAFFACFAWVKVHAFTYQQMIDFDLALSMVPILSDPWA